MHLSTLWLTAPGAAAPLALPLVVQTHGAASVPRWSPHCKHATQHVDAYRTTKVQHQLQNPRASVEKGQARAEVSWEHSGSWFVQSNPPGQSVDMHANNTPTRPRDEPPRVPSLQSTTCTTNTVRSAQLGEEIHMTHGTSSTTLHTVHHAAEAPETQAQHTYHITDGAPHRICTFCAAAAQRLNTDVAADEQVAGWELQRSVQMAPGWGHGAGHARSMMHSTQHVQGRAAGHHGWWRSQCFEFFL